MTATIYAATPETLADALAALESSAFVAVDTEFMRESSYYAKLCLVQMAANGVCVIIDPLAITDLSPLWQFLAPRSRLKVLHAARQDLEVLVQADTRVISVAAAAEVQPPLPVIPAPIFDTQIAAGLLGLSAQIGYGALVAERLEHTLEKGQARTDWTRRPLADEQLSYAADDVRYLAPLYENLRDALIAAGRLQWLFEETAALEEPRLYRADTDQAWKRLKGLERLRPDARAIAKRLANWREARAIKSDKPRGWILADELLREIAERQPATKQALEQVRGMPGSVVRKRGDELLAAIEAGRAAAHEEDDVVIPARPPTEQLNRVTKLMSSVRTEAQQLNIAPEMLATRRDVEQLVFSGRTDHLLRGWRREVIGERIIALAAG